MLILYSYAPDPIPYGMNRYKNETRRLYGVLEKHLQDTKYEYLVNNRISLADIAHWGWIASAGWAGVDINEFPALKAWEDRMAARPGVAKGKDVPDKFKMKELLNDPDKIKELEERNKAWVQRGMKEDAEKQK